MHEFNAQPDSINQKSSSIENGLTRQAGESLALEGNSNFASITNQVDLNASKKLGAMDVMTNWAKDSKGNYVTKNRWGQLLTRDNNGHMVDYKHFVENKRSGERNQMAFTSVLFCNPMMLLGLGATFAFMDHFHKGNSEKEYGRLQEDLNGKKNGKQLKGYSDKDSARALLLVNDRRPLAIDEIDRTNRNIRLEEEIRQRRRKFSASEFKTRNVDGFRPIDKSNLSRKNLAKMKIRLEEQLEQMRGTADLKDIAQIESQIEKLDRALKRFSNLSL